MKFAFFLLFVSAVASAQWNKIASSEFELDGPPKKGSAAYKADYAQLRELQAERDNDGADCKLARKQRFPRFDSFFAGPEELLSSEEAAVVKPLLDRVFTFTVRVAGYFKDEYGRERPYNVDPQIVPCAHKPEGATSYPSSHAAAATVGGCLLAQVFADRAEKITAHADYLGQLRVIVGVHHPSDVKAGQELGKAICERLLGESDFKKELKAVVAELP